MRAFFLCVVGAVLGSPILHAQDHLRSTPDHAERYLLAITDVGLRFDTAWTPPDKTIYLTAQDDWRNWSFVSNYEFGRNRGSIPMINDLGSVHPFLRDQILTLIYLAKLYGIDLAVVESYRTVAKQSEYFNMGRRYTRSKGGKSKHQFGLAVDVVPIVNGQAEWNDDQLWRRIGYIGEGLGLRWGGRWRSPYDPAHFEWHGGLSMKEILSGEYPAPPKDLYPCWREDLKLLLESWRNWEVEQQSIAKKN